MPMYHEATELGRPMAGPPRSRPRTPPPERSAAPTPGRRSARTLPWADSDCREVDLGAISFGAPTVADRHVPTYEDLDLSGRKRRRVGSLPRPSGVSCRLSLGRRRGLVRERLSKTLAEINEVVDALW